VQAGYGGHGDAVSDWDHTCRGILPARISPPPWTPLPVARDVPGWEAQARANPLQA